MNTITTNNTNTNIAIRGLKNNSTYKVRVAAVNNNKDGLFSRYVLVTPTYYTDDYYYDTSLLIHMDNFYVDNTSLLMDMEGENNSIDFRDISKYNNAVIGAGDAKLSSDEKKEGNTSLYLNGKDYSYLEIGSSDCVSFGTDDFTIELWIYPTSLDSSYSPFIETRNEISYNSYIFGIYGSVLDFTPGGVYGNTRLQSNTNIQINKWTHVAVTRKDGLCRLFIDGQIQNNTMVFSQDINCERSNPLIGQLINFEYSFIGYMDNIRVTKKIARYIDSFEISSYNDNDINKLLVDYSIYKHNIIPYNNPIISNNTSVMGGNSLYLDGSNYIIIENSERLGFGSEDYTIEAWVWLSNKNDNQILFDNRRYEDSTVEGVAIYANTSSGNIVVANNNENIINGPSIPLSTWTHLALVKTSGILNLYVNGAVSATINDDRQYSSIASAYIGSDTTGNQMFTGYIDEFRVTKGVARYRIYNGIYPNFTVSYRPYPDFGSPPTIPSEPLDLSLIEYNNIINLSWNNPNYPNPISKNNIISINNYIVEYSNDNGDSWIEYTDIYSDTKTITLNTRNKLVNFNNNFQILSGNNCSINNYRITLCCNSQDNFSSYSFIEDQNLFDFEISFLSTFDTNRNPSIVFYNDLGSVKIYYNSYGTEETEWNSALGINYPSRVVVGIEPQGQSTVWSLHDSLIFSDPGIFNTIKISINPILKNLAININGIVQTYYNDIFSNSFKNFSHNHIKSNNCSNELYSHIDYIKYSANINNSINNRQLYNLSTNNSYLFRIKATNSVGSGPYSNIVELSTITDIPQIINIIPDDKQVFIAINPNISTTYSSPSKGYSVLYSSDNGSSWNNFISYLLNDIINIVNLENNTTYIFKIAHINFAGIGPYSEISSAVNVAPRATDNLYNKTKLLLHMDA